MLIATRPGTNPVTGFPAGAAAAAESKGPSPRHLGVERAAAGVFLGGAALEAAGAAGEVVGAAVGHRAVPVAGPDVRARESEGGGASSAAAKAAEIGPLTGPRVAAALARVPPLKVEVLA